MWDILSKFAFIVGFSIGLLIVCIKVEISHKTKHHLVNRKCLENRYNVWMRNQAFSYVPVSMDTLRYGSKKHFLEAQYLFQKIKITCIILVYKPRYRDVSNATWAQSCNNILFLNMTKSLNKIPIKRTKENSSWSLLCRSLLNISSNMDFNWVLIVKDDTYAIVENLRFMVASLNYQDSYYLGHGISSWGINYNSGDAGYVLSKGSLTKFLNYMNSSQGCFEGNTFMNKEDYYLGKILTAMGIQPFDTRDCAGFSTFYGFNLQKLFLPGSTTLSSYYTKSLYPVKCCSPYSITFKTTSEDKMYTFHYLLYKLQIFYEGNLGNKPSSNLLSEKQVWQSVLRNNNIFVDDISPEDYYKLWENLVNDPNVFAQKIRQNNKIGED
ncbi:glycoprotein-N-acetylgalactosamine 3-beta-galactosyltransferase 1 [Agrilus planipennis]|uniref:N-acetylgalactosaminide beta-1,3-galactosyltransferase n=1 Tax=Agrilus planipennis TaxID=224129 RepID=A0A1W4WWF9_AGRPL|nr:glycoprotein-N-acetylgalactosamine 3-beta-galactosyltransferase 1 [Agrilus planipennis]